MVLRNAGNCNPNYAALHPMKLISSSTAVRNVATRVCVCYIILQTGAGSFEPMVSVTHLDICSHFTGPLPHQRRSSSSQD